MDRVVQSRKNLESLVEEDGEEESVDTPRQHKAVPKDSDESSDEEPDPAAEREPNKFDNLTDGVVNSMALVHSALQELLELKDKLLDHALPPNVLVAIAVTTGKVFRSISDVQMPVNELVRMVRLYSIPWEEKSTALKKLHENYEVKQRQLNKAINRLKLVDSHSKRIAKEKKVMNWEKLFSKVMGVRGHGRRWKFLIETIKQKAKLGLEHVQAYSRTLDESSDEDEDDIPIQFKRQSDLNEDDSSDKPSDEEDKQPDDDKLDTVVDAASDVEEVETAAIEIAGESEESDTEELPAKLPKKVRFAHIGEEEKPAPVKPPSADISVWTHEPEYEHFLHVRIFRPEGLDHPDIKCSLSFGKQFFKTSVLSPNIEKPLGDHTLETLMKKMAQTAQIPGRKTNTSARKTTFEEFLINLPPEKSDLEKKEQKDPVPKDFQISVHQGQFEEIVGMATIDLGDLKQLDLKTVDEVDSTEEEISKPVETFDEDASLSDEMDIEFTEPKEKTKYVVPKDDPVKGIDPLPFPFFSLQAGKGEHKPCGTLPLIFYYGKRLIPRTVSRQSGTHGVNDLVFELTGIDLHTTTKEDLHKVMKDEALSVVDFTPEPQVPPEFQEVRLSFDVLEILFYQDTVSKQEYDSLIKKHSHQMEHLQQEYEKKMQTLMDNLKEMQQLQRDQLDEIAHQTEMARRAQQQADDLQNAQYQKGPPFESPKSRKSSASGSKLSGPAALPPPIPPTSLPYSSPQTLTPANSSDKVHVINTSQRPQSMPRVDAVPFPPVQKPRRVPRRRVTNTRLSEFFERLQMFEEESQRHRQELYEKTMREIREEIERKLAGEHKLSKQEEEIYDALRDVSLPALFMPFKTGNVFNPRAHLYFHPTGCTDPRLTQPPSMLHLPPISQQVSFTVIPMPIEYKWDNVATENVCFESFELSRNFQPSEPGWLLERFLQQRQQPGGHSVGFFPNTPVPPLDFRNFSPEHTPIPPHATQTTIPLHNQQSMHESNRSEQGVES
ncbi:hypothetical protein ScPMuIL_011800 [Solemya velum]